MSIDRPLARFRGRTFRELVLIVAAVVLVIAELKTNSWATAFPFVVIAVMFASRMFPARVVYVSACLSAIALHVGYVIGLDHALSESALQLAGCGTLAILACGRDLVRRFDDEGRAVGCFANYWRALAMNDRRRIAWMSHALSACGAALYFAHLPLAEAGDLVAGAIACSGAGLLLLWGRAIAAPVTLAVGACIACSIGPKLATTDTIPGGYLIVAFACACIACVVALPWSVRFVRRLTGR